MIDLDLKIRDIPGLEDLARFFVYQDPKEVKEADCSMNELASQHRDMETRSISLGLETLLRNRQKGKTIYQVYEDEGEFREDVVLFSFPSEEKTEKPFVVVCGGGGYTNIVNGKEGYPIAARYAELGYPSFVLNYRVNMDPQIDYALSDLANGIRYILDNVDEFGITNREYILVGFSAGAHLISQFTVKGVGYGKFGLPVPKAIVPVYVPVVRYIEGQEPEGFSVRFHGSACSVERLKEYDIISHIDGGSPAAFFAHAVNDKLVPYENSVIFMDALKENGVKCDIVTSQDGGHGFGYGNGTGAEGWIEKSADFIDKL